MIRVFTSGVFDLFHIGHLSVLQKSKALGDYLIVGVHPDKAVESYKHTSIIPFEQRIEIIRNITCVDEVIEAPRTCDLKKDFYEEYRIDIHSAGDSNHEFYELPIKLGIMKFVERCNVTDTTNIIQTTLGVMDRIFDPCIKDSLMG